MAAMTTLILPSSVTAIGEGVFENCTNLVAITPRYVNTSIAGIYYDFTQYPGLEIEDGVLVGCTYNPLYVVIPNTVTRIGNKAFKNCRRLKYMRLPFSVTHIGYSAFEGTEWYNDLPDGIIYLNKVLYGYKGQTANSIVSIIYGTVAVSPFALYGQTSVSSVVIPETVTDIGCFAFGKTSLKQVTVPKSVDIMGRYVFEKCRNLKKIYCERTSKPSDWQRSWNSKNEKSPIFKYKVEFGRKG